MKNHKHAGFSLVELAIALIVIGLIIGGVLKGRELIESARLKTVLTQLNEYRVATSTFMDMFDALPGDFSGAKEYIRNDLLDGNGDGIISGLGLASDSEAGQYWAHLAAAGLIPQPGPSTEGTLRFDKGAPSAKIGGGITISHEQGYHWFVLGAENGQQGNGALLTPKQAMSLDKKIDNGLPTLGRVRAKEGAGVTANACINTQGHYNTLNESPSCVLYFQF